jgi:hypothetical protein
MEQEQPIHPNPTIAWVIRVYIIAWAAVVVVAGLLFILQLVSGNAHEALRDLLQ